MTADTQPPEAAPVEGGEMDAGFEAVVEAVCKTWPNWTWNRSVLRRNLEKPLADIRQAAPQASRPVAAPEGGLREALVQMVEAFSTWRRFSVPQEAALSRARGALAIGRDLAALSTARREPGAGGEGMRKALEGVVSKWEIAVSSIPEQDDEGDQIRRLVYGLCATAIKDILASRPDQEAGRGGEVERLRAAVERNVYHAMSSAQMSNVSLEDFKAQPDSVKRNYELIYLSSAVDGIMAALSESP